VANTQAIQVPSTVAPAVLSVSGLSASIQQQPAPIPHATAQAQFSGYSPSDFRSIYDVSPLFSRGIDGSGQTVAIASFADFSETNVDTFDQQFNLPSPSVTRVSVSTGARLGARNGEDEAEMDIELVQAAAPGARILMYEAPNTDQGQVALFNRIVSDDQAKVVTTSWGGAEQLYPTSELNAIHQALQEGAAQGQAFFAASGDSGAYDQAGSQGGSNTALDVDYPASDPWVTGVGGTTLEPNGTQYGTETAWSDESDPNGPSGSGGGLSTAFTRPSWQTGPGVSNSYSNGQRQVPDVAADSDPSTGYAVYTADPRGSSWAVVGGTSAASPVWGGFAALVNQATGHTVGFLNPTLYRLGQLASTFSRAPFHDVTQGDNLYYPATPGWDFATGWGTFDADAFVSDLATLPAIPTATPTATPAPTQTPVPRPTATKLASVQLTKVLLLHSVKGKQKTTSSLKVGEKGTLVVLYSVMNSSSKPQTATVQIKQGGKVIQTLTLKPTTYAGKPALAATVRYTSSSRVGSLHATATVRLGALASSLGYTFSVVKP
jgi:kumamolisin